MALNGNINSYKMVWEYLDKLNDPGKGNKVTLLWVPEHRGVNGNEVTNNLTKKGARKLFVVPELFCGISCSVR